MSKRVAWVNFFIVVGILFMLNVLSSYLYFQWDLTEEKRFTLADATRSLLQGIQDPVEVEVLLEGEFPAGFKRLKNGVDHVLRQFQSYTPYLEVEYIDPNEGSMEEVNTRREQLSEVGIVPTNLRVNDGTEMKEKLIYPTVIFNFNGRKVNVNILENSPGFDQEQNLNNSLNLLEYKFANALQKIQRPRVESILFSTGRGELSDVQTQSFERLLNRFYMTDRVPMDSTIAISPEARLLIIAKPTRPFSDRDKFIIDQYVMNGGKVLWLIDNLKVNLDSLATTKEFIPPPMGLNLDDLLFKYGVRLNNDLALDLECTRIPQVIGSQGGKPQIELIPWYYHPLAVPTQDHPIVKNLDRVNLFFPGTIDTVKTKTGVKKTVLLTTSEYSRKQLTPTRLNFEILRYQPDPKKFQSGHLPMAVLLEGEFSSLFENKLTEDMKSAFDQLGIEVRKISPETKMVVVSDGDLAKNLVDANGRPQPLGYNKWEKFTFPGNSDFLLNTVEYLMDERGLLESRSKNIKLRLLDKVKCQEEKSYWQMINIGLPLILLVIFGFLFQYFRKKRFA